jgi:hypothetical protein
MSTPERKLRVVESLPYDQEQDGPVFADHRIDPSARALAFALICVIWTVLCWALIIGGYYWFLRDALS